MNWNSNFFFFLKKKVGKNFCRKFKNYYDEINLKRNEKLLKLNNWSENFKLIEMIISAFRFIYTDIGPMAFTGSFH